MRNYLFHVMIVMKIKQNILIIEPESNSCSCLQVLVIQSLWLGRWNIAVHFTPCIQDAESPPKDESPAG